MKRKGLLLIATLLTAVSLIVAGCAGENAKSAGGKIVVGSKNFNENIILGEMLAQLIEAKTDLQVERKLNLGGTLVCFNALKNGDLDLYPDYTGTGLMAILKQPVETDPDKVYNYVQEQYNKKFKLKWLKPFGFNNTYAIAVPRETAEKYNLEKVSDLVPLAGNMVFGAEQEFFNRPDGYDGLVKTYGLKFKNTKSFETALKYQATAQGKIDVTDAFSTDGELITYDLKILEDDKKFFPPYFCTAVVRMDTLEKYPELEDTLNMLAGQISDEEMQQLNYQVAEKGRDAKEVVREFLENKGII
ncbi:osmoprotectant transport system substrate-binding protein [Desulfofundulus australicus DSM 11792]|uniref:Osmoprotectant transport system substrate-binding protein n=1 Tax=Desulfofundulus australicus DSM 11792 TaxID=1121425 RepID=A0A1M4Y096_9FIRM|nr:glycine betaine ABC transporter substrate-binding protein [Desulfofundulus australicus]SHE99161.1 osmoprotectant transport system substrate-binding protein [Desulfofundulus australicus DSM 11792]